MYTGKNFLSVLKVGRKSQSGNSSTLFVLFVCFLGRSDMSSKLLHNSFSEVITDWEKTLSDQKSINESYFNLFSDPSDSR